MAELFTEYAHAIKGVRRIEAPRGLQKRLGLDVEQDDAELNETVVWHYKEVATLHAHEWRYMLHKGEFGDLL